jgi:dihydroneopterin aldolase
MQYRIYFKDLEVTAKIGIHEFERRAAQRFIIDIDLLVSRKDEGDRLTAVVDYDFVRDAAIALAQSKHFELQETYCEELLALLDKPGNFDAIMVTVGKPDVFLDVGRVGCTFCTAVSPAAAAQLALLRCP